MESTITITPKWQIYLPEIIRKQIGLTTPTQLHIRVEKKTIILTPKRSKLMSMAAKLAPYAKGKKIDLDRVRDYIDYSQI